MSGSAASLCIILPLLYPVNFLTYANATIQVYLTYAVVYVCIVLHGVRSVVLSEAEHLEASPAQSSFFFAFIIPNFKEDEQVLEATLSQLADHPYASRQFLVLLAMEGRESGAAQKVERLQNRFRGCFVEIACSIHELEVGIECPGKASNATAAGIALSAVCRRNRIDAALVNVTVMDADTLISPRYVLRLDKMLTSWQAAGEMEKVTMQIFTPYMSFCNIDDVGISLVVAATDLVWGMAQESAKPKPNNYPTQPKQPQPPNHPTATQ